MKKSILISAALASLLFTACMTSSGKKSQSGVVKSPQVLEVERKMKAREESLQDSKDRRRVLAKKETMTTYPQDKKVVVAPLIGVADTKLSERDLYAELVRSYDMNNEIRFFSRYQSFMKIYSRGALADDAIYLAGLLSLTNKNYGPSLKYFNQILKQYPASNKTSGALFAKGVAMKKMNLIDESKKTFALVRQSYPGSPEALRAESELKILKR